MSGGSNSVPTFAQLETVVLGLHQAAPDSIGDLFHFSVEKVDECTGCCDLRCETAPWMANVAGTLHGGISSAVVDQAMGFVVYCIQPGKGFSPTVQMQLSYHRPLMPGDALRVRVYVMSRGKTAMHLRAEVYSLATPDKLCVSATAVYQFIPA